MPALYKTKVSPNSTYNKIRVETSKSDPLIIYCPIISPPAPKLINIHFAIFSPAPSTQWC